MKYAMFAGDYYYPCGGWSDFVGFYEDAAEAVAEADRRVAGHERNIHGYIFYSSENDWVQIVDLADGSLVHSVVKEDK